MIDGRYSSLGLAVYKTLRASPDHPAFGGEPIHAWLYNGLRGMKPFLEAELQQMRKTLESASPEIREGSQMNLDQLKEEVRWVEDAIECLRNVERERGLSHANDVEIEKINGELK